MLKCQKIRVLVNLLLILFLFQIPGNLHSQDHKVFIAYDPVKALINEHSISLGYNFKQHHFVVLSFGYTYVNESLRKTILDFSPSQDEYPVLVNTGPVIRGAYGYRVKPFFYFGADLGYKYLQYSNHRFQDSDGKDHSIWYTRDEESNVLVGHINCGFQLAIPNIPIVFNPSVGIGPIIKFRNHTTYDIEMTADGSFDIPEGTVSKTQTDFSFIMNMNIGIAIGKLFSGNRN